MGVYDKLPSLIIEGRRSPIAKVMRSAKGGLARSAGGCCALRTMRKGESRMKGDERILGQGDFVESVLKAARRIWIESLGFGPWGTTLNGLKLLDEVVK